MSVDIPPTLAKIREELREACEEITPLLSDYPRALRRWAEAEKATGEHYIMLSEILVKALDGEDLPDEHIQFILDTTARDVDTKGAWRDLEQFGPRWDTAIRRIARAADRYSAYRAYEEGIGTAGRGMNVADLLRPYEGDKLP